MPSGYNPSVIDFDIRARTGSQLGCRTVTILGQGPVTTTEQVVYPLGSTIIFPSGFVTLVSTSTDDAGGGTGANAVAITGVNSDQIEVVDILVMNGTTPVTSAVSFIGITQLQVVAAGSNETNAGDITCGSGVSDIHHTMDTGIGLSKTSAIVVQDSEQALALGFNVTCSNANTLILRVKAKVDGLMFTTFETFVSGEVFITVSNLSGGAAPQNSKLEITAQALQPGLTATINLTAFFLFFKHGSDQNSLRL